MTFPEKEKKICSERKQMRNDKGTETDQEFGYAV